MNKHEWKNKASCLGVDTNLFFERYEDDEEIRPKVEAICSSCPVVKQCFAVGISQKEWGVWGGVFLENGRVSREFNRHRTKADWAQTWQTLTMENGGKS
jgi:hypothetical protein